MKAATVKAYKKRKLEISIIVNMIHQVEENELSITDISNTKDRSRTWFWNKSRNGSDLDTEKDRNSDENKNKKERNLEKRESKIKEIVDLDISKFKIK